MTDSPTLTLSMRRVVPSAMSTSVSGVKEFLRHTVAADRAAFGAAAAALGATLLATFTTLVATLTTAPAPTRLAAAVSAISPAFFQLPWAA